MLKISPEIPGVWRILSPTTAMRDKLFSILIESIIRLSNSKENSSCISFFAIVISSGLIAKQMECSLKTCDTRMIFIFFFANVLKILPITP